MGHSLYKFCLCSSHFESTVAKIPTKAPDAKFYRKVLLFFEVGLPNFRTFRTGGRKPPFHKQDRFVQPFRCNTGCDRHGHGQTDTVP